MHDACLSEPNQVMRPVCNNDAFANPTKEDSECNDSVMQYQHSIFTSHIDVSMGNSRTLLKSEEKINLLIYNLPAIVLLSRNGFLHNHKGVELVQSS